MAFHLLFERNDLRRSQTPLVDFGSSREAASNAASGINISLSGKEYRSAIGHPNFDSPPPKHVRNRNGQLRVQNENTAAMWREGQTVSPLLGRIVF
jgi:hypothetical protein